ncbi:MAG: MATE family efflux transporter [ANME-2 cluster archaeon]|nr:MATE family efflux transporter [ANME-2 cluster archaeon]MDF1557232.1 MATE family efflux transporter [ANME-2 cluster archaeon]
MTPTNKKPQLIDGPVGKILLNLTVPMIFGMVGMVAFNLVDTFFVGQLGTQELAALSFTFPIIMVIGSLAMGIGTGASAVISKAIGRGDHHKVKRLTTDSLILSFLLVAFFVAFGILTIEPLFSLLGAEPDILPLIREYMVIWYPGVLFVILPMVGNNAIRATGDTKTPSAIMLVAVVVNIVLDPLLIFGLGPFPMLGLAGAAIATVFARAITLVVALWVLYYRDRMITLELPALKELIDSWKSILYIGLPVAGTRLLIPISMGVIYALVASYGHEAVAAFGVGIRIEFLAMTVVFALSTVIGPFVGQNWGARRFDRVVQGVRYSNIFSLAWGVAMFTMLALAARPIASLFNDDPQVISIIMLFLWIVPLGYALFGVFLISTMILNILNKPLPSAILMVIQMVGLYIPLAYVGSYLFGLPGIFAAIVLAYSLSGIASYFVLKRVLAIGG